MDIVFVRHGRTEINEKGCYGGSTDCSLSQRGIDEIKQFKKYIDGIEFDAVYVSPLKRTIESAEIIGLDYIIDSRIREINFGVFEGLNYKEVNERYPEEYRKWNEDYLNYRLPQGESMLDVFKRTEDFLSDIANTGKRLLVVTHGGIIRNALSNVFGSREHFYKFKVGYGTANIISIDNSYSFIKGINCTYGLKEILI